PEVRQALDRLVGAIDAPTMIDLNAQVKLQRVPVACATADFLNEAFGIHPRLEMITWWQQLARYTVAHLQLVAASLFPAILVAILLGVAAAKIPALEQPILATVGIIQTIPALALLVLLIPLLGIGFLPAVAALFLYSLLPIVRATHQGLTGIPANLSESALAIGLPSRQRFFRIELPMAMPAIVSGIKVAAVLNVGFATLGALISAGGYGQPIMTGIRLDDMHLILLGAIPSALLALFVQWAFDFSERWLVPRGLRL
ncbi:MAG: ABC transporter permease subunit, partial [Planctomycetota bacterium]